VARQTRRQTYSARSHALLTAKLVRLIYLRQESSRRERAREWKREGKAVRRWKIAQRRKPSTFPGAARPEGAKFCAKTESAPHVMSATPARRKTEAARRLNYSGIKYFTSRLRGLCSNCYVTYAARSTPPPSTPHTTLAQSVCSAHAAAALNVLRPRQLCEHLRGTSLLAILLTISTRALFKKT
jgi:hypothetical protein